MIDCTNCDLLLQKLRGSLLLLLLFLQTQPFLLSFSSSLSLCLCGSLCLCLSFLRFALSLLRCEFGCPRFISSVCTIALAASPWSISTGYTVGGFFTCATPTCARPATTCTPMLSIEVENCAYSGLKKQREQIL